MKRYLICDTCCDYKEITEYVGLVNILIDNLHEDTLNNINEEDIVKLNYKTLETIAKGNFNYEDLKEDLKSYGYIIMDLQSFKQDLLDFQAYLEYSGKDKNKCIEETIDLIEKVGK